MANLWVQVNRSVHAQLVKALSGQANGAITISNGQVVLNLGPFITWSRRRPGRQGLLAGQQHPGDQPDDRPVLGQVPGQGAERVPAAQRPQDRPADPHPAPARRRDLHRAQPPAGADRGRARLGRVHGGARHRAGHRPGDLPEQRAVQRAARQRGRGPVRHPGPVHQGWAAHPAGGRPDRGDSRLLHRAVGHRRPHPARAGQRAGLATGHAGNGPGLRTGPVGRWTYQHRTALRIGAVALFALIFVFWGRPTAAVGDRPGHPAAGGARPHRAARASPGAGPGRPGRWSPAASSVLVQAAGLAVLAAISPTALLVAAVYLGSARPRQTLLFYLIGALVMSTVMGVVVLVLLRAGGFSLPHHRTTALRAAAGAGHPDACWAGWCWRAASRSRPTRTSRRRG